MWMCEFWSTAQLSSRFLRLEREVWSFGILGVFKASPDTTRASLSSVVGDLTLSTRKKGLPYYSSGCCHLRHRRARMQYATGGRLSASKFALLRRAARSSCRRQISRRKLTSTIGWVQAPEPCRAPNNASRACRSSTSPPQCRAVRGLPRSRWTHSRSSDNL